MTGAGPAEISDRNSGLGCAAYGEFLMGQWETPLRYASVIRWTRSRRACSRRTPSWAMASTADDGVAPHSFDRRQKNFSIHHPKLARLQSEGGGNAASRMPTGNPMMASGLASFASGDWFVAWGTSTTATSTTAPRTTPTAWRRPTPLAAPNYAAPTSACAISRAGTVGVSRRLAGGRHPWLWSASTARARIPAAAMRAGTSQWAASACPAPAPAPGNSLGYGTLSKRTELWTSFTRLANGSAARYNLAGNPCPNSGRATPRPPSGRASRRF